MDRPNLALVIPAINEETTIGRVIDQVKNHGLPIVVDDGSSDRTGGIAAERGARVVRHLQRRGYDEALNSGFECAAAAGCEYVITLDADGQHDENCIPDFVQRLRDGFELVLGVRERPNRASEFLFAWVTRALYGVRDPLCGMKGYGISVYRRLGHFDSYGSIGTELALFGVRTGSRWVQLPIRTRPRKGKAQFGSVLTANARILRALWLALFPALAGRRSPRPIPRRDK